MIGLRHLKHSKRYIPVLPKSHLKYLQIFLLYMAYNIIAPFSGRVCFKVKKEGKHSKVANFAVKKKICVLDWLHFHIFMHCKLAL